MNFCSNGVLILSSTVCAVRARLFELSTAKNDVVDQSFAAIRH